MKNNRNGQAEVLTDEQLDQLLAVMQPNHWLLFSICYYTSCRVSEALKLKRSDIIGDRIVFRACTTKTKMTRDVKIPAKLSVILSQADFPTVGYLFPGKCGGHLTRQAADLALRKACDYIGLKGVSTHSFRRTGLTKLYKMGVPLKTLQERTGHADLGNLSQYLAIGKEEVDAIAELL
ncbi:MAG: tyrosine-type recombinase/integrase [Acaryochloris sp. CRU_2_0]|nr:tyrosine-type recombinase/integrase [Acaryochloris sp. CRU_2_0]